MSNYRKVIVAAVGLFVVLGQSLGWELPENTSTVLIDFALLVATIFGVWQVPNTPKRKKTGTRMYSHPLIGVLVAGVVLGSLTGCAGTRAAYEAADGLEETAKVVAEHYYATVRELNDLDDAGALTPSVRADAQELVRRTAPLVQELAAAAQAYEAVHSAQTEAELQDAINDAAIAVSRLIDLFKGAGSGEAWRRTLLLEPRLAAA